MISRFFIYRPIGASVIAVLTVLFGLWGLTQLPVARYPDISPPTVSVSTVYPGANADVVADTVATPIEKEVNGVEKMLYMQSTCASDGSYNLTVTFDLGTDLDIASVMVQNRVAVAQAKLPPEVTRQGITTKKKSTSITLVLSMISPDGTKDPLYLGNYAIRDIKDELSRIYGVGEVVVFGSTDYSMRVWFDPNKLKARNITTQDVVNAISEQNVQVAAGQIGQPPADDQVFQFTVNTLGRLSTEEQFRKIIVKTGEGGRFTRVGDVARVELGAQDYNLKSGYSGDPGVAILVYQLPGANALDVAERVKNKMKELKANFPSGVDYAVSLDTTEFVEASIEEVITTLWVAIVLVIVTIYVFLQDWRATLIPVITIPVSLVGTLAVMVAFGSSINMVSLFGLVLAIGIVVDDAIVVVENTTRHLQNGLPPREAATRAMEEVTGPVIATTAVLLAVFVPSAMLPGITGQLYRQFAITISASTVLSSINALTLSPAMCAVFLRKPADEASKFIGFRLFNRAYDASESVYASTASFFLRRIAVSLLLVMGLAAATGWGYVQIPSGFLPVEDQGYIFCNVQLPDAASLERSDNVIKQVDEVLEKTPGIKNWVSISGYSIIDGTNSSNMATVFITLDHWAERQTADTQLFGILGSLQRDFRGIQEAQIVPFPPPAIEGLGVSAGFEMRLQDRGGLGPIALDQIMAEIIGSAKQQKGLNSESVSSTYRPGVPQLFADVDREKVKRLDVPLDDVFGTLQAYLGSVYVNDFTFLGRNYQVRLQADSQFRSKPEDIAQLDVRNRSGDMVPIGSVVEVSDTTGPQTIMRYNLYPAAAIQGSPAPGFSSGQSLLLMEDLFRKKNLPTSAGFAWTGMSYQEKQVGSEAIVVFGLAIIIVFLVLAFQYESLSSPFAVIAVVPLAVLGAVVALAIRTMDNNVYTQIGLVLLVALASKNAILIVEFAAQLREQGKPLLEAAAQAARLRFRAILMTSFSFALGTMPLLVASGAGAASRRAVGTAVFGGMIAATVFSVLLVPMFFVLLKRIAGDRDKQSA